MLKNYLKIALRSLLRNKVFSIINICGLAVGLATGVLILLEVSDEVSYDQFHHHIKDLYLMMVNENEGGEISTHRTSPSPLSASLLAEVPEVLHAARSTSPGQQTVTVGDRSFFEQGMYADPDFFALMTFPAVAGDPAAALRNAGSAVITERLALKLFGNADPIDKILVLNNAHTLNVKAVIKDVPANSSNQFDIVLPFRVYEQDNSGWVNKWDNNRILTWAQLKPSTDLVALNRKLKPYLQQRLSNSKAEVFAYPFGRLWLEGSFTNGRANGGLIQLVKMIAIIGGFVLLIACINFMNLATAQSEHRAREVGVRKVLGAPRRLVVLQFLNEAVVMTFLALVLGALLARLALPAFNHFARKQLVFDLLNWKIWLSMLSMGILTGLVAGSYPAFFLSAFQPVKVLKGTFVKSRKGAWLRKGLVTFQFIISIFLIIGTIVISKQIAYLQDRPIGYDQQNLIQISAKGDLPKNFMVAKNALQQIPGVTSISGGSDNLVQFTGSVTGMEWPGKQPDEDFAITVSTVQYDWTRTTGLKMAEGRDFSPEFADSTTCLLNQAAVRKMRLKSPVVGQKFGNNIIIGVVEDFVYNDPSAAPKPMVVYLGTGINHLFVRVTNDEKWRQAVAAIGKVVKSNNGGYPFEFNFTKEEYQKKFTYFLLASSLARVFGGMAIFISCLGLFGLSAFIAERRTREMGIRKVLGASTSSIWFSLSKDFLKPVLFAFLIAAPLAGLLMQKVLGFMDYHIGLAWWMFALAGGLAVVISIVTVSYQGLRSAFANPVRSLRTD
ncbi:MAG: ABC transporter permease [Bacteroidetes bacterium]|nr:ABC transporter permease [Bacteroidota bacterium]